ncbi:MAG: type II toxin-antitoxin system Phd/YefM family antitoxin [Planctomycetes bacterium]|nr:type II toxin-antitoxin system Phd/YefM family antitoxin [Planctomycetota bacterium]
MEAIDLSRDVKPITEFRSNASGILSHVKENNRPLLITQNGKSSAVLLDVHTYEKMMKIIDLQSSLLQAEDDIRNNKVRSSEESKAYIKDKLGL